MRSAGIVRMVVVLGSVASVAGCSQIDKLKARKAFKDANAAYQGQDYRKAVQLYQEVIATNPDEVRAYFYLANSYDQLYKSDRPDDPANRQNIEKAVNFYQTSAEKLVKADTPENKILERRSYEYLAAAYGEDRLNDAAKAEPIIQKMIQMEPTEPTNYIRLARLYEDAGVYDEAEAMYLRAREVKPSDPVVYTTLAAYYNRRGEFDKTIKALEERAAKEPNNPEAFHTIASYYWDETRNDPKLRENEKRDYIQKGIQAADKAIQLKPDYVEAITFKGLLLRLQALVEKDPGKQKALLEEAKTLSDKANGLQQKKTSASN